MWEAIGTSPMGRNLFDLTNGWEGHPPAGDHVVVVSHRPKPEGWHPEAPYHFVDGWNPDPTGPGGCHLRFRVRR
ncbi:hypothetical protein [Nonomuraea sp. KM88]|uniref:hypothetical protein n=1 Tax=Nonomuraea sp. KM88 TaxID=3457427 RepID=UPI003FCD2B45